MGKLYKESTTLTYPDTDGAVKQARVSLGGERVSIWLDRDDLIVSAQTGDPFSEYQFVWMHSVGLFYGTTAWAMAFKLFHSV